MSDKRKSVGPIKRPSRVNVPAVRPKRTAESAEEEAAEATAAASGDARVRKLIAERDALRAAMREAATVLLRALKPGERISPPPLPTIDVSEIAEMVDSLRPPPDRT